MATPMQVDVVSPEERLFSGEATAVYARSTEGELGILAGHVPILIELGDAPVRVQTAGGQEHSWHVTGGFLEFRENRCVVLADEATPA
jgi:F-type H+-transporting ATPase subunit epsilon